MERWASNTLRTLGIILTAGFVIITSLVLVLLSMCAAQPGFGGGGSHPDQAIPFLVAAAIVVVLGICFIVWLARGIFRSAPVVSPVAVDPLVVDPAADRIIDARIIDARIINPVPAGAPTGGLTPSAPTHALPLHLSPLGRKAVNRLVFALGAQIVLSAFALIFNQFHFWSNQRRFVTPLPYHNWPLVLLVPFILYHIPYAMLIYFLLQRPDRRTFAYSLAVPAVFIMQSLLGLGYFGLFARHPLAILLLVVPWLIHIVIIVLAYKAIQQVGLHPQPSSLIVAAVVTFVFFTFLHVFTPFLYRFLPR